MTNLNFSARAHDRILKAARPLADLAGLEIRAAWILKMDEAQPTTPRTSGAWRGGEGSPRVKP